ncbi:hypothetical protein [Hymenobacter weizhouensis]|uniref:hypothetical protein n=1 Tax=Hymenobacter sp. YIM 151500-1 TaxID=2987689 RepID=UPI002227450F|nr:hypothetical protein [Hymenobacter sp. YIM 151500-1]UYZ64722.1 hypothetical protein OIS53_07695 [Hymenobacter sp. YIM 151500-1]
MHYIIDTNVPVTANGKSDAGPACVKAAAERLEQLKAGEILVLDTAFIILNEYDRNLNSIGQPGPGDAFYLWALRQRNNPARCEQVPLQTDPDGSFTAFPTDSDLAGFDSSDRKFVALALTHPARPAIVNATDTDWHKDLAALQRHGVTVEFICPEEMSRQRL